MFYSKTTTCFSESLYFVVWGFFLANEEVIYKAKLQIRAFEDVWKTRIDKNNY